MAGWVVGKLAKAGTSSFWSAMVLDEGDAGSLATMVFTRADLLIARNLLQEAHQQTWLGTRGKT